MFGISGTELFIIIVFVLVIFGPDKLPQIGRTVGQFMREFKRAQESMEAIIRAEVYATENKPTPGNTADMDDAEIFEGSADDAEDEGAEASSEPQEDGPSEAIESGEDGAVRKSPFDNVAPEPETTAPEPTAAAPEPETTDEEDEV